MGWRNGIDGWDVYVCMDGWMDGMDGIGWDGMGWMDGWMDFILIILRSSLQRLENFYYSDHQTHIIAHISSSPKVVAKVE